MGLSMARRTKRLWTVEEKRSICFQTTVAGVSVAQVARRYALNANLIFKWLRDPRFAPDADASPTGGPLFLPVEVERPFREDAAAWGDTRDQGCRIEIDLAGGHRMRINGRYDPRLDRAQLPIRSDVRGTSRIGRHRLSSTRATPTTWLLDMRR
jgi:transposase